MNATQRAATGTIKTFTGRYVHPLDMKTDDLAIEDIAHSLARLCRYNGHCGGFISVARHSIWVSEQLPKRLKLWGLLHDAPEAYLGDMTRPVKRQEAMEEYRLADHRLEQVVSEAFGLPFPMPKAVHDADMKVFNEIERPVLATYFGDIRKDEHDFLAEFARLTQ
jgi:5'-deoxynucleotidase YfbR-like HD superfamily hydrolase